MTTNAPPEGRSRLLERFRQMLTIRLFENRVADLHAAGEIVGSTHLCAGQEAIPTGAAAALAQGDVVFATYRGHGWALALGVPLEAMFGELMGRAGGICGGRGGSAYLTAPANGLYGENAIVGAQTALALGPALAARFDESGRISLASLGEGAMNQGATTEAMNFAAAMKLPVVFVCENNSYSELTPTVEMVGSLDFCARASALGLVAAKIDGNDPLVVEGAVAEAATRARAGEGPTFIEALTARVVGHYIGDAQTYRSSEEMEAVRRDDPLERVRRQFGPDDAELAEIESQAQMAIERAVAAASAQPYPDTSTATAFVYA
jgi:TPP-dependent pyruvate/acetoin dehydrogenase alpha subunit